MTETTDKLVSIVYMQGDEADEVLDMIERFERLDEIQIFLDQWNYGNETLSASLHNGHTRRLDECYDGEIVWSAHDGYYIIFHRGLGYVQYMRRMTIGEMEEVSPTW